MKKIILSLLLAGCSTFLFADSPITSTNFYEAYLHHELVKEAKEGGELTIAMAEFLSSTEKKDSIQLKVALINALSWDIDGKENGELYWSFLERKYGYRTLPYDKLSSDELLCMGYLRIMDDYNSPKEPLRLVSMALKKNRSVSRSYTYQMITALIRAQNVFLTGVYPEGWCKIYQLVEDVEQNKKFIRDFKPEATEIIFDYIRLYEEYCEDEEVKKGKKPKASATQAGAKQNSKAKTMPSVKPKKANPDQ